ncbi:UPF0149 family protein [Oxalobacter sp. OttesenSCG-928-P03]|nr:UPF0149 family protein [Oxalobacter sp. OttesenSCG-928-P03]
MSKKNTTDPNAPDFDLDRFLNGTDAPDQLDNKQFEKLEIFLENHQKGMHMEILDGFFCGLICGPDAATLEEFLPYIFGGKEPEYASPEQAEEIKNALNQHWAHIEGTLINADPYYPFLYSDNDFKVSGNDWALGFVLGLDKYRESWQELLDQAQHDAESLLTPILTLYLEKLPENTEGQIHAEDREVIVTTLVENLPKIYHHFDEAREKKSQGALH